MLLISRAARKTCFLNHSEHVYFSLKDGKNIGGEKYLETSFKYREITLKGIVYEPFQFYYFAVYRICTIKKNCSDKIELLKQVYVKGSIFEQESFFPPVLLLVA